MRSGVLIVILVLALAYLVLMGKISVGPKRAVGATSGGVQKEASGSTFASVTHNVAGIFNSCVSLARTTPSTTGGNDASVQVDQSAASDDSSAGDPFAFGG